MSIPTYVEGFPPDGTTLGQTKKQIRDNLDGTFRTLSVNHYNNNSVYAGKHEFIQLPVALGPPTTGATELAFYNGVSGTGVGGANNLFFQSYGGQGIVQMTRHEVPVAAANGFTWLPGPGGFPFILQWGVVTFPPRSGTVTFVPSFAASYNVQCTLIGISGNASNIDIGVVLPGSFTWSFTGSSSSSVTGFYWMAIGI